MSLNTYLGQKGYTIPKKDLSLEQQQFIKKELIAKPYTPGSPLDNKTFYIFRESPLKFYIPRYFGEEHFGKPKEHKISAGTSINLQFNGELREIQKPAVEKYLRHVSKSDEGGGGLLEFHCAAGKTLLSLYIIAQLQQKTLVIVHKEFLMNQWIERIQSFLPNARIGKIQGQIIDIENKDIVLCMLQSLSMKEYPESTFQSFGLTIIDEVHHISSEVFSCALFKLVTKYMLGLSATMNRKDGTTKIFKMFLGDIIYKSEHINEHAAEVRSITYKSSDPDFNNSILDYKGQPQISSMISKLCSYNRRTEFIISTLNDFICVSNVCKEVIKAHKENMDNANPCCKICNKKWQLDAKAVA